MSTRLMLIIMGCVVGLAGLGGIIYMNRGDKDNGSNSTSNNNSNNTTRNNSSYGSNTGTGNGPNTTTDDANKPTPTPEKSITPTPADKPAKPATLETATPTGPIGNILSKSDSVFYPRITRQLFKNTSDLLWNRARIFTNPNGHAVVSIKPRCVLHFFSDKKNKATLSQISPDAGGINYILQVGYGILTNNCGKKVVFREDDNFAEVVPNGTWFAVANFPDPIDKSKTQSIIIVLEGNVTVKSVRGLPSGKINIKEREFMFLSSDNKSLDNNKNIEKTAIKLPERFEDWKELYEKFDMKNWLGTVAEIYKEQEEKNANLPTTASGNIPTSKPDNNTRDLPFPNPTPSRTQIDFGELLINEEKQESITFTNESPIQIGLYDYQPKSDEFKVDLIDCNQIKALTGKCDVKITFRPEQEGKLTEKILINHNADKDGRDKNKGGIEITVEGIGKKREETFLIVPSSETFTDQKVNTLSTAKTIPITVQGPGKVKIGKLTVNNANYQIKDDLCSDKIIDRENPCAVSVIFNPNSPDEKQGRITIPATLDSSDLSKNISLKGNGVEIDVIPVQVSFDKAQKKVKKTKSPKIRAEQDIRIEQPGNTQIKIDKIEVVEDNDSKVPSEDFRIIRNNCQGNITNNCTMTIAFSPQKRKLRRGTVLVYYNSIAEPKKIPITGYGKHRCWFLRVFLKSK